MIDYKVFSDFDQTVYTVNDETGEIEEHRLRDLCEEYALEVCSPKGIQKEYFYEGTTLYTWRSGSNSARVVKEYETEQEAEIGALNCWLIDLEQRFSAPMVLYNRASAEEVARDWKENQE
jgi:hypothetical protein